MYDQFYNLRERPFALSPDPEYLYLSHPHREALDSLRYGIESRAGFIVITGEIGAGKTTLLQTLLSRLDERVVVARLVNTTLEPRELLEAILLDFGLDTAGKTKPLMLRDLGEFLIQQRQQDRRPLLVIDEAQNLSVAALEEIRLLSNFETEKSKLIQIVLAGQPDLRHTLALPSLEQFRQRIAVSYHLRPLDANETAAFINSRLAHAALGEPLRFPREAAEDVYRRSGGLPRLINLICDAALVFGYAEDRRTIDAALIRDVTAELELTGVMLRTPAAASPAAPSVPPPAPAMSPPMREISAAPTAVSTAAAAAPPRPGVRDGLRSPQDAVERAAALADRENAVARRERQLAEQRRVLEEQMRLRRSQERASTARLAESHRVLPLSASPMAVRFDPATSASPLPGWLRRLLGIEPRRETEDKLGHVTRG